jgi:putative phosphoesterase
MKIGILSDTHNHVANLRRALDLFRVEGITTLIHCGDMTSPETAAHLAGFQVIYTVGNSDGSAEALHNVLADLHPENIFTETWTGTLGGVRLAATHGHLPGKVESLVRSGRYAFVFHGHTHRRREETAGWRRTRVINPGALGGARYEARTVCILDLDGREVRFVTVSDW